MRNTRSVLGFIACIGLASSVCAYNLIDTKADPRTVAVWNYLQSQYGKKMLTGCWTESQYGGAEAFHTCSGEWPAIWGQDMNSWYKSRTDPLWTSTWNGNIQGFKTAWGRGEIPQVNWHWQMVSSKVNGAYTRDAWGKDASGNQQMMTSQQWNDIVTPGTALYNAMIEDIDYHVTGFLKKLVDASGPLPILFRPLHEIDGGWFWWTCTSDPSKTAQLYRIIQDRVMDYHQMHNLIWIYNPGVLCNGGSWPPYQTSEYARRQAFYVGDTHCDIVGIDLYDWDWINTGAYTPAGAKTYRDAWNVMKAVSSTKMIALCECQGFPDPAKSFTDANYAPWLYALPWYSDESNGVPCDVLTARVNNSYMINASDLPDFKNATAVAGPDRLTSGGLSAGRPMTERPARIYSLTGQCMRTERTLRGLPGGVYLLATGNGAAPARLPQYSILCGGSSTGATPQSACR